MDIYTMTIDETDQRIKELDSIVKRSENLSEINACTAEKRELVAHRQELADYQERKEVCRMLEHNEIPAEKLTIIERSAQTGVNKVENENIEMRSFQKFITSGGKMNALSDVEQRALAISGSGAVLPGSIFNTLITSEAYSDLLQRATVIEDSNAGTLQIPIASNTAASWKIENTIYSTGTTSYEASPTITSLSLGGFELYRWMKVSAATMSRSTTQFTDMMLGLLGGEVIAALEYAFVRGAGTTEPVGLASLTWNAGNKITTTNAATPITAAHVAEALSLLPQKYARNAIVLVNSDMAYNMSQFVGTTELAYNMADGATKFLGKPIVISEHVADDTVYIVDPTQLYVRFSMPMALEVDKSSGFNSASYDLRALTVVDAAWNPAACVSVGLGAAQGN